MWGGDDGSMPSRVMGQCPQVEGTREVNWNGDKRRSLDGVDVGDAIALRRGGDVVSLLVQGTDRRQVRHGAPCQP